MLLEMKAVSVSYGKVSAVRDISISVPEGGIVTIIGGNGLIYAPVTQTQTQGNWMAVSEIGRVLAGG